MIYVLNYLISNHFLEYFNLVYNYINILYEKSFYTLI